MDATILKFILVGFLAQMVDGAIGMAYGVISTTFLLSLGIAPATASASVKAAETITSGVSGFSHHLFGNVDRKLVLRLVIPGVIGGITGAYILTTIDGKTIKPYISAYLVAMGLLILYKAIRQSRDKKAGVKHVVPLGLVGGFVDAIGGGGWGPVVTSNLVAMGNCPRMTVGSVNAAEFFVTLAQAATFVLTIGLVMWQVSVGLLIGGVIAAPFAALVCKRLPRRTLMILVGVLISITSLYNIYKALM